MRTCDAYRGIRLAFEFLGLTAAHSGEDRQACWRQIDRDGAIWTVLAGPTKSGREALRPAVRPRPGCPRRRARTGRLGRLGVALADGRALHHAALPTLTRDLGIDTVPHRFQSSFRDWAAECTDVPREACKLALAHGCADHVEAAYRRTDLFSRPRVLAADWAAYVA